MTTSTSHLTPIPEHIRIKRIPMGRRGAPIRNVNLVLDDADWARLRHYRARTNMQDPVERIVQTGEVLIQTRSPSSVRANLQREFPDAKITVTVPDGYFIR